MARLIVWVGLPLAWWAGGPYEALGLSALGPVLWLWCALVGWRRPSRQGLVALWRVTLASGVCSALLFYPAVRLHGPVAAVRIDGALLVAGWALRVWLLSRAAALLLELGAVPRMAGILAPASILGGSLLFWREIGQAGRLAGPHTPLEAAHLWWAYTGGVLLALVVPIVLLAAVAVTVLLREQPPLR